MLSLVVALLFSVSLSTRADDPKQQSDKEITEKLVGKWVIEINEGGVSGKGYSTFKKDLSFEFSAKLKAGGQTVELEISGTWKVEKGEMTSTVAKSNNPTPKKGDVTKDKVIQVDDTTLKLKNEKGEVETYKRVKE
jgi:uncharacterized protein (TIGR03066 family)